VGFAISPSRPIRDLAHLLAELLFLVDLVIYATAAFIPFRVLSSEDLAVGYVLLFSLTFILVTSGSVLLFNETISPTHHDGALSPHRYIRAVQPADLALQESP
jgi:hypothetical protein